MRLLGEVISSPFLRNQGCETGNGPFGPVWWKIARRQMQRAGRRRQATGNTNSSNFCALKSLFLAPSLNIRNRFSTTHFTRPLHNRHIVIASEAKPRRGGASLAKAPRNDWQVVVQRSLYLLIMPRATNKRRISNMKTGG